MSLSSLIAIVLAGLSPPYAAAPSERPVRLVIDRSDADVVIRVVGRASAPTSVRYMLETTNRSGGNHSRQRGNARLAGDRDTVLLTAHLGQAAARDWQARLEVEWDGGSYTLDEAAP